MPTEKISKFLDHHLQPLMKQSESHIKDTGDFLEILKKVKEIPKGDYVETEFLKTQAIKPCLWKRFTYDTFFICADSEKNLNKFLKDLNEFHPNLKFTYEKSKEKINFLDLVIKLTDGKIVTDLYCKPTDSHQYLHYDLCHAEHIKNINNY